MGEDEVRHLVKAEGAVQSLSYPMTLVDAHDFLNMSAWECHEEWRDRGKLTMLDTLEEVHKFKELNFIVFISHQWLGHSQPDSRDRVQELGEACLRLGGLSLRRTATS